MLSHALFCLGKSACVQCHSEQSKVACIHLYRCTFKFGVQGRSASDSGKGHKLCIVGCVGLLLSTLSMRSVFADITVRRYSVLVPILYFVNMCMATSGKTGLA